MLKVAAQYEDLLRQHGIDPNEVIEMSLSTKLPGHLEVRIQSMTRYINVIIQSKESRRQGKS